MIFEVITAVKVANDAIAAIKEMAGNVSSIGQLGAHLTKLTDAEDTLKEKAQQGDMEAFFELEKINNHKRSIRELMIYSGRPGLWEDWNRFQATRRELRENAKRAAIQKKKQRREDIKNTAIVIGGLIAVLSLVGVFILILQWFNKGGV